MKKILGILFLLAVSMPAFAQRWNLSSDDQARFDSYYSRWQQYQQENNGDQVRSMEGRMQDVYRHYNIPSNTPYWRVASNGRDEHGGHRWNLSSDDQARFDSYFSRWQDSRQRNDRDQVRSMEGRMQDVYRRYNIPDDTPYFKVASNGRDDDDDDRGRWGHDRWRGRLSGNDQARFNSYFSRWRGYRQANDRDQTNSMERRMYGIYDDYHIPHDVPFDQVAQ